MRGWADDLRNDDPERFKATSRWHYINAQGGGCAFDVARGRALLEGGQLGNDSAALADVLISRMLNHED